MFCKYAWLAIGFVDCPPSQIHEKQNQWMRRLEDKLRSHGLAAWRSSVLTAVWQRKAGDSAVSSFRRSLLLSICKAWGILATRRAQQTAIVKSAKARIQTGRLTTIIATWRALAARRASLSKAASRVSVLRKARKTALVLTAWHGYAAEKEKLSRKLLSLQTCISLRCSTDAWRAWMLYTKCIRAKEGELAKYKARIQACVATLSLQQWHVHAAERRHLQSMYTKIVGRVSQSLKRSYFFSWQQLAGSIQPSKRKVKVHSCSCQCQHLPLRLCISWKNSFWLLSSRASTYTSSFCMSI